MLILRLHHAQHAIADGRLDEACDVLSEATAQQHRKGQELIGKLIKKLVARGREHLGANRFHEALADCDRAAKLGGRQPEVTELREQALAADQAAAKKADRRKQAIAAAKRHIERGEIELGHAVCDEIPGGTTVVQLKNEAERREILISNRIQRVERAFESAELNEAVAGLRELKTLCPNNDQFLSLLSSVGRTIVDHANEAFDAGRLTHAVDLMDRIYGLVHSDAAIDCRRCLELGHRVASNLANPDLRPVIADLRHLQKLRPNAAWIVDAIADAETSNQARDKLNISPITALQHPSQVNPPQTSPMNPKDSPVHGKPIVTASVVPSVDAEIQLPSRTCGVPNEFLLQVDGAGSSLVSRKSAVTFGPRSSSNTNDIEVLGQGTAQVTIERADGDYFLKSNRPIVINNRTTESKLLSHGDRIELGARSSLRFTMPCAASSSAVIELTGCKATRGGCRRLVMLDNALVISGNGASHLRSSVAREPYVVFVRDNRLQARPMNRNATGGSSDALVMDLDVPVILGDMHVIASSVKSNRI